MYTNPDNISVEAEEIEEAFAVHLLHVEAVDHDDTALPTVLGASHLLPIATLGASAVAVLDTRRHHAKYSYNDHGNQVLLQTNTRLHTVPIAKNER